MIVQNRSELLPIIILLGHHPHWFPKSEDINKNHSREYCIGLFVDIKEGSGPSESRERDLKSCLWSQMLV